MSEFVGRDSKAHLLTFVRMASICGMFIYPLWSVVYQNTLSVAVDDPIWERFVISALCFVLFFASYAQVSIDRLLLATYGIVYAATAHLFWVTSRNDIHPAYQLGVIVLITACSPYFYTVRSLFVYAGFVVLCCLGSVAHRAMIEHVVYYAGIASTLIMSWIALYSRLAIVRKLDEKKEGSYRRQDRYRKPDEEAEVNPR